MHTYRVDVTREDRWWIIRVPELKGYRSADGAINVGDVTQARSKSEIRRQAVDFIATVTDSSEFDLEITYA